MKYSICIPSRGHVIGLWATICAVEHALAGRKREYIIMINGQKWAEPYDLLRLNSGGAVDLMYSEESLPPPIARNRCAKIATGDWLVFLDDHVLVAPDWFDQLEEVSGDVVHSSYSTHVGYHRYYHSIPRVDLHPLIMDYSREPLSQEPYRCQSAPHGGFCVKRSAWNAIGGYGDFWTGFGGEEVFFDTVAINKGFGVWMNPKMFFYHFSCRSETRGYATNRQDLDVALEIMLAKSKE